MPSNFEFYRFLLPLTLKQFIYRLLVFCLCTAFFLGMKENERSSLVNFLTSTNPNLSPSLSHILKRVFCQFLVYFQLKYSQRNSNTEKLTCIFALITPLNLEHNSQTWKNYDYQFWGFFKMKLRWWSSRTISVPFHMGFLPNHQIAWYKSSKFQIFVGSLSKWSSLICFKPVWERFEFT